MDIIKEYKKTNYHICPLCLKDVKINDDFICTITKGILKRNFAHINCYNKLIKSNKEE